MPIMIEVRNAELLAALRSAVEERGIEHAAISLIGGVDAFTLSNMTAADAKRDAITTWDRPGELTATGEVADGQVHVHAVCGVEDAPARAGHLVAATVATHFVRAYITELG